MTYIPNKDANSMKCPIARTFDEGKSSHCDGEDCILWRWRPLAANDNRFMSALKREMHRMHQEERAKNPKTKRSEASFHKDANAMIAERPWDFINMGDEDRGYCGLGGKPQ